MSKKSVGIGVGAGILGGIAGGLVAGKLNKGGFEINPKKLRKKFEKAADDTVDKAADIVEDAAEVTEDMTGGDSNE